jgi:phytoene dehydrogenase-like protein
MQSPPASAHSEKEWLEIKQRYIEDMMSVWEKYALNMTLDNLIGVDSNSPYDQLRMKNLTPHGNAAMIDRSIFQLKENRPIPELANHRTPVRNLYATGTAWHPGENGGAGEAYNCFKIMAAELDLDNPWQKLGNEETESLLAEVRKVVKRTQGSLE